MALMQQLIMWTTGYSEGKAIDTFDEYGYIASYS